MATHLAHKLPWGTLEELFLLHPAPIRGVPQPSWVPYYAHIDDRQTKMVDHFARCLAAAVQEFRESDQSTEDERGLYDPRTWPYQREYGAGAWPGFYDVLVEGYVTLNLILSDPTTIAPRFSRAHGARAPDCFALMLGHHDGSHPPQLTEHLQQAFDGHDSLKPMTAEVAQVLRDHAAMLFRWYCGGCDFDVRQIVALVIAEPVQAHQQRE